VWSAFRFAPYLRLLLLTHHSRQLRTQLATVRRVLKPLAGVGIVLAAFVCFCAWVGMLLYGGHSVEGSQKLPNFGETAWQLTILLTTCNFPDVMMPAYTSSRSAILFFGAFLLIGTLFLLNLILAVVVNAHKEQVEAVQQSTTAFRERSLRHAYLILQAGGARGGEAPMAELQAFTLLDVFLELNHYKEIAHIDSEQARLAFAALDRSGEGTISLDEFLHLAQVLELRFERANRSTWIGSRLSRLLARGITLRLAEVVRSAAFENAIDLALTANGGVLLMEQWDLLNGSEHAPAAEIFSGRIDSWWNVAEVFFTSLFVAEMCLKLLVLGFYEYVRSLKNCLDAFVSLTAVVVTALVYLPNSFSDSRYIRYVLALRLVRLLRLLGVVPQVRAVSSTFVHMLPAASDLLKVLCALIFTYAALGVYLFGGLVQSEPPRPSSQSDFGTLGYYPNNFNDMGSACVTCFELLIVNNWFVICEGIVEASGTVWARLYFLSFYILAVLVCLNIFVAFAIESFDRVRSDMESPTLEPGSTPDSRTVQALIRGRSARFDAAKITGTSTGVTGEFRAVARRAMLMEVFSQVARPADDGDVRRAAASGTPAVLDLLGSREPIAERAESVNPGEPGQLPCV